MKIGNRKEELTKVKRALQKAWDLTYAEAKRSRDKSSLNELLGNIEAASNETARLLERETKEVGCSSF